MNGKNEQYAVEIRYPDEIVIPSKEEVKEAIEISEEFKDFIIKRIGTTV